MENININNVDLIISAVAKEQYPVHDLKEIAMCGRSNVGKSSFINSILSRNNIARVSSKPGKTKTINFFNIDNKKVLVDIPGYGYAKVSKNIREKLYDMIVEYFINSKNLACVFHLLDSRHKPSEEDIMMNEFLNYYKIPFYVILTKTDKISKNELSKNQKKIENLLDLSFNLGIISYSIISKKNKNFILDKIINI
ncbi:ribosome biogenesis GTP-binding protein YihA/YsxC [Gemelliphila asaccharolytica]|uniref:Probable GTP-binding protein EngB n=1 Tax=Gemelliphila asaccharolytica TaxID=502393 RepID=A0ABR5TLW6_9BACL|nr:ribosome biogenesis GTP-binding protein YihA/YsxC [Gemella asaccharolytica]KXB58036.1 ribosome biogenesis GTP-binding protein YsxC [Gemella asaccharolytica]